MIYFIGIFAFFGCLLAASEVAIRRQDFTEGVWAQQHGYPLNALWSPAMRRGWASAFWDRSNTDQAKYQRARMEGE